LKTIVLILITNFAGPLEASLGTLEFLGTPVEKHCPRAVVHNLFKSATPFNSEFLFQTHKTFSQPKIQKLIFSGIRFF
jgi:hypothetical protein